MLDQLVRWTAIAGTAVDVLLLVRILWLRLHRTYQFVTLYSAVEVLLDVAEWTLGLDSPETQHLFWYSRFLMLIIFPLAAWDCFEGVPGPLQALRRPQLVRLISGMLLTGILAMLLYSTTDDKVNPFAATVSVAFLVWISAAAASLGFIWIMRRMARVQKFSLTGNPATLSIFFMLTFGLELIEGILEALPQSAKPVGQISEIALTLAGMAITIWCVVRLRPDVTLAETAAS
jgi:hypothetical protein